MPQCRAPFLPRISGAARGTDLCDVQPWQQWGRGGTECGGCWTLTHAGHYICEAIAETGNLVAVDVMVSDLSLVPCLCRAAKHMRSRVAPPRRWIQALPQVLLGFSFSPMALVPVANEMHTLTDRRSTRRWRTRCRRSRRLRWDVLWRGRHWASRSCRHP